MVRGDGTYAEHILPFVRALGRVEFGQRRDASSTANRASERLRVRWQQIAVAVERRVGADGPIRLMVKHHPLKAGPGRCVVLQLDLSTAPDLYLDGPPMTGNHGMPAVEAPLEGFILRLRAVYQLEASRPLLVEARAEVQEEFRYGGAPFDDRARLGIPELIPDGGMTLHFEDLDPGVRWGLLWLDRSYGVGPEQAESAAYVLRREGAEAPSTSVTAVPPAWVRALQALVQRI